MAKFEEQEEFTEDEVNENVNDEEILDEEVQPSKIMRFFHSPKAFYGCWSAVIALLMAYTLYGNYAIYNPPARDLSEDNIYEGNELIASSEHVCDIITSLEDELGITIDDEYYEDYCLLNAILENGNLKDEEKDVFYRVIQIIKENPYVNKEEAYHSLLNVDVLHKIRPPYLSKETEGVYNYNYESIGIFVDDPDYRVLIHEIIHCVFENDKTVNLPTYFKEGVTELLANEYFSDKPFMEIQNYPFEVAVIKMLCEVSSADAVLEAYSTGDMSIIAKEIAKVTKDEEKAMKALDSVDLMMRQFNGEVAEKDKVSKEELINGFIPLFRQVVETKYEPEEHSRVSYFYNEILMANIFEEKPYDGYVDDLVEFGVDHKGYFSTTLKETIKSDGEIKKIKATNG